MVGLKTDMSLVSQHGKDAVKGDSRCPPSAIVAALDLHRYGFGDGESEEVTLFPFATGVWSHNLDTDLHL